MCDWETYTVYYRDGKSPKSHTHSFTALSIDDAKSTFKKDTLNLYRVTKVVKGYGMPMATPKQKLAQKYGFILGSIKGAQIQFKQVYPTMPFGEKQDENLKVTRAINLVESQFAKLQRDIRDCFKLAGLKVK